MANAFKVESATFCDYITEDINGKPILIGVYNGELRFVEAPELWPVIYLSLVIDPIDKYFKFSAAISGPDKVDIFRIAATYNSAEYPPQENRLVMNLQMPAIKFSGPGIYSLKVSDDAEQVVLQRDVPVNIGPATPFMPSISVEVSMNQEFRGEASAHPSLFSKR